MVGKAKGKGKVQKGGATAKGKGGGKAKGQKGQGKKGKSKGKGTEDKFRVKNVQKIFILQILHSPSGLPRSELTLTVFMRLYATKTANLRNEANNKLKTPAVTPAYIFLGNWRGRKTNCT